MSNQPAEYSPEFEGIHLFLLGLFGKAMEKNARPEWGERLKASLQLLLEAKKDGLFSPETLVGIGHDIADVALTVQSRLSQPEHLFNKSLDERQSELLIYVAKCRLELRV